MTNPWVRCQFSAVIPSPSRSAFPSLVGIEHLGLEACQGPGSRQTSTDLRLPRDRESWESWESWSGTHRITAKLWSRLMVKKERTIHEYLHSACHQSAKSSSLSSSVWRRIFHHEDHHIISHFPMNLLHKTLFPNCSNFNFPPVRWQCFSPPLPPPRGHREKPRSEAPGGVWLATLKDCNSNTISKKEKRHHKRSCFLAENVGKWSKICITT